jgi:putative Mg2+ transporter-C (MgtC) family protein
MAGAPVLPEHDLVLRLAIAALLGGLIGLERERLDRAAGLRTHALVSVSSALMMIVSAYGFAVAVPPGQVAIVDPSRLAAQVVTGIGFLGAGVIIFQKNRVRGLTTAASIWSVAGVGLAAGGGLFLAAGLGTLFILFIQAGLRPIERRFFLHHQEHRLALRLDSADAVPAVESILAGAGIAIRRLRLRSNNDGAAFQLDLDLGTAQQRAIAALLTTLRETEGVRIASYIREPARVDRAGDDGDGDALLDDDGPGGLFQRPARSIQRLTAPHRTRLVHARGLRRAPDDGDDGRSR